jgi:amino acid transporter
MSPLLHQETTTTRTHLRKRKQKIKIILLITLAFHTIQMFIYCLFHLENPLTLMDKTILFGVIKCVVTYFLFILVFGK